MFIGFNLVIIVLIIELFIYLSVALTVSNIMTPTFSIEKLCL